MIDFLHNYEKRRYGYGTLQEILRELSPLPKGGTSNPAVCEEWKKCVNKSLKEILETEPPGQAANRKYTELQAFNAMVDFFISYYKRTLSEDLRILMEIIFSLSENNADQASWNDWNCSARKALQKQDIEKFVDGSSEKKLTELQAYNSMFKFLDEYYKKIGSDLMGWLLGSLSFIIDGGTANPAFWDEWGDAVEKILQDEANEKQQIDDILGISLTESQAFKAMVQFFKDFYERGPEPDIMIFFDYLHLLSDDSSDSPTIREKWKQCVNNALKEEPGARKYLILGKG